MFLATDGALLNTVSFGSGPRTLVAHGGWVGSWELWQDPIQLLQSGWRCIAYDHRGAGATAAPTSSITPEALVDDLFAVLDAQGVDRCVLAGESLGALTCTLAVLRDPSRFEGLILVDGTPRADRATMAPLIDGSRADFPATVAFFVDACVPDPDAEHLRRWGRQILLRADPEAAARILEVHADEGVAPDHAAVTVPTLVVHGELDLIVPVDAGRQVADAIPGAELIVIPGAGHVPTVTHPADVAEAIEAWAQRLA
ncbi:MAG: alpha/beta hydrolase [Acidimicrobiales bacterium]